jgi:hypothetical protein
MIINTESQDMWKEVTADFSFAHLSFRPLAGWKEIRKKNLDSQFFGRGMD